MEWLIPVAITFVIGVLVGALVKQGLKLLIGLIALIGVLSAAGYVGVPGVKEIFDRGMEQFPKLFGEAQTWFNMLPFGSISFLLGLALGFWKG